MAEATFLILTALASESRDGYRIIADVERMSSGRVRLRAGTLYPALDRLRADGLVGVDREEIVQSRLRRYYRLTPKGEQRLAREATRFHSDAAATLARLSLGAGAARVQHNRNQGGTRAAGQAEAAGRLGRALRRRTFENRGYAKWRPIPG